ncbi:guanine nucleotide exchange factor, putative [Entamoeba invadens IP1]|uniref:guanine nucleotide exchange factor, putative n=1 Tax=Entamoeba invadens IP1 TaxID=370355 RepID=UPI0002C3F05D|nr:guanine nucleotide exchange factor, putative [Entamoeba invadens IP1]ELP85130.1 guanine nucleotide exchange factor, putative [Entamoeba invadens IP1]|eukprot:XP_004184476.1 guanine nucleotide exchange factor, putative [Entamoeba invadens IP1]
MQRLCERCQALVGPLANDIRNLRTVVLGGGSNHYEEMVAHLSSIKSHTNELRLKLSSIDCFCATDDVLEIYDTVVASVDDLENEITPVVNCSRKTLLEDDGEAKLMFSQLMREMTQHLFNIRNGLTQLSQKIMTMRMATIKPELRGDFSSLLEIMNKTTEIVKNKDFQNVLSVATQAKDRMISLTKLAVQTGASDNDQKAVVLSFRNLLSEIIKLKNLQGNVAEEEVKVVYAQIDIFKRAIRAVAMGNSVVLPNRAPAPRESSLGELKEESQSPMSEADIAKRVREEERKRLEEQLQETKKAEEEKERARLEQEKKEAEIKAQQEKEAQKLEQSSEQQKSNADEVRKNELLEKLDQINMSLLREKEELDNLLKAEKEQINSCTTDKEAFKELREMKKQKDALILQRDMIKNRLEVLHKSEKAVRKPLKIKGDFGKTIKRQKYLSKEMPVFKQSAVELRKQLEIDKSARVIKQMNDDNATSIVDIARQLTGLSNTLDLDNVENTTDVYQILRQTDFNSIALRITSPKFRISSSISYIGHFVPDNEYDPEKDVVAIEKYEKEAFYDLAEKASDIATTVEDMMCFGSLSIVAKDSSDDYLNDLLGSCQLARKAVVTFMNAIPEIYGHGLECKSDDKDALIVKYRERVLKIPVINPVTKKKDDEIELVDYYQGNVTKIERTDFKSEAKLKHVEAALGLNASIGVKKLYQTVQINAEKIRSVVGQFLAMSKCISHLQPKDFKNLKDKRVFDSKDFEKECDKIDKDASKEFSSQIKKDQFFTINLEQDFDIEILYIFEILTLSKQLMNYIQDFIDCVQTVVAFQKRQDTMEAIIDEKSVTEELASNTKLIKIKNDRITCGSLNMIIYQFVMENNTFEKQFFSTFQFYTTPTVVLSKLVGMYFGAIDKQFGPKTLIAMKHFIDEFYAIFDSRAISVIHQFIEKLKQRNENSNFDAFSAVNLREETKLNHTISENLVPPITFFIPLEATSPSNFVLMSDPSEVARQLTLVISNLYQKIEKQQFFNKAWSNEKLAPQAMDLIRVMRYTEEISDWIVTIILLMFSAENRVKAAIRFIQIADYLNKLNNFQLLYGIIQAFDQKSKIWSLKLLDSIPSKFVKMFSSLSKVVNEKNDFKNYRQIISKCNEPCIPLLPVVLKDLEKIHDNEPDKVKLGKVEVINVKKAEMVVDEVEKFMKLYSSTYPFPAVEPFSTYLKGIENMGSKTRNEVTSMWTRLLDQSLVN